VGQGGQQRLHRGLQGGKGGGSVGHQVDLVHGHKQVAYAHQAAHIQVAAGLGGDAARRIHQQDAASHCDAADTMLRVYWVWPGQSASTSGWPLSVT
jgi:hypothetical protein